MIKRFFVLCKNICFTFKHLIIGGLKSPLLNDNNDIVCFVKYNYVGLYEYCDIIFSCWSVKCGNFICILYLHKHVCFDDTESAAERTNVLWEIKELQKTWIIYIILCHDIIKCHAIDVDEQITIL